MLKIVSSFLSGVMVVALMGWHFAPALMFTERESPFGMEETIARIQGNIQTAGNGWSLSGLRDPGRAVARDGGNVLPVMMVETCSTKYSKPILKDDTTRMLSILMPCKISVYKKEDGKVYIGMMNAGLMGKLFGPTVAGVMTHVAADQAKFVEFDASQPAPPLIRANPGEGAAGGSGASGSGAGGGC